MRFDEIQRADTEPAPSELSRRAALRLIQRAFVLTGRDRNIRQHIRAVHIKMMWVLEDEELEWAVLVERGRIEFDRRPVRKPDVTLTWHEARTFFESARSSREGAEDFTIEGRRELRRTVEMIWRAFRTALGNVLMFPFDDEGVRLA